ncbi:hypothetical protein [Streptomyces sp. NPDC050856]|uniref:hypothetical protein n=1 Tax=Streptomyces sp. NPDC050856 TaxID=3154939 RepID=UPI003400ED84
MPSSSADRYPVPALIGKIVAAVREGDGPLVDLLLPRLAGLGDLDSLFALRQALDDDLERPQRPHPARHGARRRPRAG